VTVGRGRVCLTLMVAGLKQLITFYTSVLFFFPSPRFAKGLAGAVLSLNWPVEAISMGDYDPGGCLAEEGGTSSMSIIKTSFCWGCEGCFLLACTSLLLRWKPPKLCVENCFPST